MSGFVADAVAAELPFLRAEAEARMTSTAAIRRPSDTLTQNETTGEKTPSWAVVIAATPFRLGGSSGGASASQTKQVGGVEVISSVRIGHFPAATTGLRDGDFVDVTGGENAGLAFRVLEVDWQDQATARRLMMVSVPRPAEWP